MKYSQTHDSIDLVNPYYFEIPTSPYDACKQLNLEIDISKVLDSYAQLASIHDMVIVEGIGGIMTPISKNYFVSDLISDLDLESIIVTGTKIGSVNHSMLTYEHARQKNLKFKGFIINQNVADGYDLSNMKHQIFGLTGHKVFGAIPYVEPFSIEPYIATFPNFVDVSKLGLENI